jgi:DNA-binding beta-propeller fold protein YncE
MKNILKSWHYLFGIIIFAILSFKINNGTHFKITDYRQIKAGISSTRRLVLKRSIILSKIKGGFDLMAADVKGQRLFLSAEDNHTVEVIDLKHHTPIASIAGLDEPKWIFYRPEENAIYVSTGKDGRVTVLDADTYSVRKIYQFKEKCNNLRYDASSHQLYVGVGDTFGSLGIINLRQHNITGEIKLADYPKQFEIDGKLIYVNIPAKNIIQVVDVTRKKVIATWPVKEAKENIPMALDRAHHRLFVACEQGKLIVYNTATGKSIASLDINQSADGIYYDTKHSLIYVSCGEGFINVISRNDSDHYRFKERILTAKGAGTSLFVPGLNLFILAVPQSGNRQAAIRLYQPQS